MYDPTHGIADAAVLNNELKALGFDIDYHKFSSLRVDLGNDWELSIAFPNDVPTINFETALCQYGNLVYIEDAGYEDVQRFTNTIDNAVEEIKRVQAYLKDNGKI